MRTFVAVYESGGFSAAAKATRQSKAAVSKHVSELEDYLGCRLLHRTTRRHHLTEDGQQYLEHCRTILDDMAFMEADLADRAAVPKGRLRVNAPLSYGERYLAPMAAQFLAEHPEITLELSLTDRFVDLIEEGYDLAVRIGGELASTLIARQLHSIGHVICASPEYLNQRGRPKDGDALKAHNCLVYGQTGWTRPWWFAGRRLVPEPYLFANNGDVLRRAAIDGAGIAAVPEFFVTGDLAEGRLICLEAEPEHLHMPVMAVYPERRHLPLKVRAFIDFLAENLERSADHG